MSLDQIEATVYKLYSYLSCRKKAIHITLSGYREPPEPLFQSTNSLPLSKVHVFKIALYMFHTHHDITPAVFNYMFINS